MRTLTILPLLIVASLFSSRAFAEPIRVLTWNVESDRPGGDRNGDTNDPEVIAARLKQLQTRGNYDLIGLTEVRDTSRQIYLDAVGGEEAFLAFLSETGDTDRLLILVRRDRFELSMEPAVEGVLLTTEGPNRGKRELAWIDDPSANPPKRIMFRDGASRRPTFVRLKDRRNENLPLVFMVNHLDRGSYKGRRYQSIGLREWALQQDEALIAVGDYNFDYDFRAMTGNQAMAAFMRLESVYGDPVRNGAFVWDWIIPGVKFIPTGEHDGERTVKIEGTLIDSNWYGREKTDLFRDSILDFVFVGNAARDWNNTASFLKIEGDFPDDHQKSDHRPLEATLNPSKEGVSVGGPRSQTPNGF